MIFCSQRWYWVDFQLWSRLGHTDCRIPWLGIHKNFTKKLFRQLGAQSCLKSTSFEQPFSTSFNYQLARNYGNAGWIIFKCRRRRHGHKRVSGVESGKTWISLADTDLKTNAVFRSGNGSPFSRSIFNDSELGSTTENRNPIDEEQHRENSAPLFPTLPVSGKQTHSPVLLRRYPFGTKFVFLDSSQINCWFLFDRFIKVLLCIYFAKNTNILFQVTTNFLRS